MKTQVYLFGFIFCFVTLFSCLNSETPKQIAITQTFSLETNWQKANFKGKIKSVDELRYYYNYHKDSTVGKGNIESRQLTKYNNKGSVIYNAHYGSENYLISETKQFYNEHELCDSSLVFNNLGELSEIVVFFYDENNLVSETKHYSLDKNLIYIEKIEYNADRKPVKTESFFGNNKNASVISETKYNDKNQKVQSSFHDISQDVYTLVNYEYDADGILVKRSHFDKDANLQDTYEFEYTYDNNGDWITCKEIRNGKMAFIVEREIQYFN